MDLLLKKPIITEKTSAAVKLHNVYVFLVNIRQNKSDIKKIIENRYSVSVKNVRIIVCAPKRFKSKKMKKALVEFKKGQSIDFYNLDCYHNIQ